MDNKINIDNLKFEYKFHPRLMEIKISLIYSLMVREYGETRSPHIFKALCEMINVSFPVMNGIIAKGGLILSNAIVDDVRRKQEIILVGELWDETRYKVSTKYFGYSSPNYLYQNKELYNFENFISEEWLESLDTEVLVCGLPAVSKTAQQFLIGFEEFMDIFG